MLRSSDIILRVKTRELDLIMPIAADLMMGYHACVARKPPPFAIKLDRHGDGANKHP